MIEVESLQRLRAVAECTQITAVIDHFRHAELLSQCVQSCANPASITIRVLIEVDLGKQSVGVCPGPDALRLALATARLPGLSVVGVFASSAECDVNLNSSVHNSGVSTIVTIAEHALRSIRDVAAECCENVILVSSTDNLAYSDSRVTLLIASPFMLINNNVSDQAISPAVLLISTVISRPTLEWCVIDAGRMTLVAPSNVSVHDPAGATILRSTDETSTLQLSGESTDLRIGDTVQLGQPCAERWLKIRTLER